MLTVSQHAGSVAAPTYRPANVLVLSLTTALIVVTLYTWYPVLPVVMQHRGASSFAISMVYTLISLAAAVLQMQGGLLADRFGRRLLLAVPTFAAAILYGVVWLSTSWQVLALALIVMNATGALQSPSFTALTAESVPADRRAHAFAMFQFATGLATLAGPALGAVLLGAFGARPLMGLTAIASLAAGTMRIMLLKDVRRAYSRERFHIRDAFAGRLRHLTVASTAFLAVAALTVNGPFIALYAHGVAHLGTPTVNLLYAIGWLPAVALSFWLGRRITAFGSARALAIGVAGHLGVLGLWLLMRGELPMMLALAASFLFYQLAVIAWGTLRIEQVGQENAGAALGAIGTVAGITSATGPILGGVLASFIGPAGAFLLAGVMGLWTLLSLRHLHAA